MQNGLLDYAKPLKYGYRECGLVHPINHSDIILICVLSLLCINIVMCRLAAVVKAGWRFCSVAFVHHASITELLLHKIHNAEIITPNTNSQQSSSKFNHVQFMFH